MHQWCSLDQSNFLVAVLVRVLSHTCCPSSCCYTYLEWMAIKGGLSQQPPQFFPTLIADKPGIWPSPPTCMWWNRSFLVLSLVYYVTILIFISFTKAFTGAQFPWFQTVELKTTKLGFKRYAFSLLSFLFQMHMWIVSPSWRKVIHYFNPLYAADWAPELARSFRISSKHCYWRKH